MPTPQSDSGGSITREEVLRMVLTAPLLVLFVVWLYQGFRHASRLSGVRLPVAFALALVVAVIAGESVLQILL
jgi:hypothetical protein